MWQPTNNLERERLEKLHELEAAGVPAFPARVTRTHSNAQAIAALEAYEAEHPGTDSAETPIEVTVCGRIRRVNLKGKVSFLHIEDETARLQLFLRDQRHGRESLPAGQRQADRYGRFRAGERHDDAHQSGRDQRARASSSSC